MQPPADRSRACSPTPRSRPREPSRGAIGSIAEAAAHASPKRLRRRRPLAYAAAGSSGLMALADALELPGTYGIARDRIVILLAGGADSADRSCRRARGRRGAGRARRRRRRARQGRLPDRVVGQRHDALCRRRARRRRRGAALQTIGIANNAGAPLLGLADVADPAGDAAGDHRRLDPHGRGTAQKIALNMLSTLAAIHLGHVHDGYMVNLQADNMQAARPRRAHRRGHRRR